MDKTEKKPKPGEAAAAQKPAPACEPVPQPAGEIGGPTGAEPTRFGDWEVNGRCSDF
jgi:hypothetical protein